MDLFIAEYFVYEGDPGDLIGVFSSEEKASEAIRRFEEEVIKRCGYKREGEQSIYYRMKLDVRNKYRSNDTEDMSP